MWPFTKTKMVIPEGHYQSPLLQSPRRVPIATRWFSYVTTIEYYDKHLQDLQEIEFVGPIFKKFEEAQEHATKLILNFNIDLNGESTFVALGDIIIDKSKFNCLYVAYKQLTYHDDNLAGDYIIDHPPLN
jgi:hypothetical protein